MLGVEIFFQGNPNFGIDSSESFFSGHFFNQFPAIDQFIDHFDYSLFLSTQLTHFVSNLRQLNNNNDWSGK